MKLVQLRIHARDARGGHETEFNTGRLGHYEGLHPVKIEFTEVTEHLGEKLLHVWVKCYETADLDLKEGQVTAPLSVYVWGVGDGVPFRDLGGTPLCTDNARLFYGLIGKPGMRL